MAFILRGLLGKGESDSSDRSGISTVEKLLHRIESVTLLADRREGLRALKAVAKEHRLDIGAHGMDILLKILEHDRADQDLVAITLEILCLVMADSDEYDKGSLTQTQTSKSDDGAQQKSAPPKLGSQFAEIFLKRTENLELLLDFTKEFQFQIRYPAVRLLCIMANCSPKAVQEALLKVGGGITSMLDLLTDNREIIRNDALLLLIFITRDNASLQKIVAFGKAFDTLLDIVRDEGGSEGGVVVEDCLLLVSHLLTNNGSNIKLFKEDGCISKLCIWFAPENAQSSSWPDQRKVNACGMLQIIRSLVAPSLSPQIIKTCQDAIFRCGLFAHICGILMMPGVPLVVLVQALSTVAELIRGNRQLQDNFAAMEAPTKPPRPVLAILCVSMFNERQTVDLRIAVLYVFKSFLLKNDPMQLSILQSFSPDAGAQQYTLGQLLGGGLFSEDYLNQWSSSIALLHCILGDDGPKMLLLNATFAPNPTLPSSTVLVQCGQILRESSKVQAKTGIVQLFCIWMSDCPKVVAAFLDIPDMTMTLISQILEVPSDSPHRLYQGLCAFLFGICVYYNENSTSRNHLLDVVRNRISFDTFRDKIAEIPRHDNFVKAAHLPDPALEKGENGPLLDYDFIRFFKSSEGRICETLDPSHSDLLNGHDTRKPGIFAQQKEALQERDDRIAYLESQLAFSNSKYSETLQRSQELDRRVALLLNEIDSRNQEYQNVYSELERQRQLAAHHQNSTDNIAPLQQEIQLLKLQLTESKSLHVQSESTAFEMEQLRSLVNQQQEQIQSYYTFYETQQQGGDPTAAVLIDKADLQSKLSHLESLLFSWQTEAGRQTEDNRQLREELDRKDTEMARKIEEAVSSQKIEHDLMADQCDQRRTEFEELNKEHTDLLEMLTDSDSKLRSYRARLRQHGEAVSEDDD